MSILHRLVTWLAGVLGRAAVDEAREVYEHERIKSAQERAAEVAAELGSADARRAKLAAELADEARKLNDAIDQFKRSLPHG